MSLSEKKYITVEEYLNAEAHATEKHEYYNGEVFAMAGATIEHNRIVSNTFLAIGAALKGSQCIPYGSDLRIKINSNDLFTYPDITIICGELEKSDDPFDTVTNPIVLIEVVSQYTADYDRGFKFMMYRNISSLKSYILIDSTGKILVENFYKNEEDIWQLTEHKMMDEVLTIESLKIDIELSDVYKGIY